MKTISVEPYHCRSPVLRHYGIYGQHALQWLNKKQDCIYVSWLVHMFANFAINTIGFMLLN